MCPISHTHGTLPARYLRPENSGHTLTTGIGIYICIMIVSVYIYIYIRTYVCVCACVCACVCVCERVDTYLLLVVWFNSRLVLSPTTGATQAHVRPWILLLVLFFMLRWDMGQKWMLWTFHGVLLVYHPKSSFNLFFCGPMDFDISSFSGHQWRGAVLDRPPADRILGDTSVGLSFLKFLDINDNQWIG